MSKQITCKSCGTLCVVDGNEITCETCGTTFIRQASGEVKVKEVGRLDKIERAITEIQKTIKTNIESESELEPEPEPEPDEQTSEDDDW